MNSLGGMNFSAKTTCEGTASSALRNVTEEELSEPGGFPLEERTGQSKQDSRGMKQRRVI